MFKLFSRKGQKYNQSDLKIIDFIHKNFGFKPKELTYYNRAITHKSFYSKGPTEDFERLELLGDTISDAIVAHYLFKKYPAAKEGFLSKVKSRIVSRNMLNEVAKKMDLFPLIKSNLENMAKAKSLGGNVYEALVGAIYLEKGYEFTQHVIEIYFIKKYISLDEVITNDPDTKSKIIIWGQQNKRQVEFQHEVKVPKKFIAKLYVDGEMISKAEGTSKKSAEQKASSLAIKELGI